MLQPCPRGSLRLNCTPTLVAGNSTQPRPCPLGHYCPNGTRFAAQFPCPVGTFGNVTQLQAAAQCLPCSPGAYCDGPGLVQPTGPCAAGYFCLAGSTTPTPNSAAAGGLCPAGNYCPAGTAQPNPCPAGTFNAKTGSRAMAECDACTPGYYCGTYGLFRAAMDVGRGANSFPK